MGDWPGTLPRRMVPPGVLQRTSVGHGVLATFALTIAVMAAHFAVYLNYALAAVRYPFELDYGEGIVWQQAMLIPGERMYGDITRFPFIVFHYPPLYHLAVRAVAALGVDVLVAGRGISLLSSLALGVLAAALAFGAAREDAGRLASLASAAVAGLTVFCFWPVVVWSPLMRVDMLAILLSFLGVWYAMRSVIRPRLLYLAAIIFVLAVYSKQTCIAAPLATIPVMLMVDPRRTVKASCLGLLLGGAALVLLIWQTDGGFLRHILLYNLNRYSLMVAVSQILLQSPQAIFVLLAVTAVVLSWRRLAARSAWESLASFRRDLACSGATRLTAILTLYFAFSTCTLATLGKSGGALNYLIEWMCIASVLIGTLVAPIVEQELTWLGHKPGRPRAAFALVMPVALLIQVLILPASRNLGSSDPAQMQQLSQLVARIRDAKQPVLSDDMILLMKAGKEVPWEPAIFAELASTGQWDERRIIAMINARDFAFIITQGHSGMPLYDSRYTPAVERAIETAYPRTEDHAGRTVRMPSDGEGS